MTCPDRTRAVRWLCVLCRCYGDHGVGVGWGGANNVTCTAHLNDTTLSALLHATHVTLSELQANGVRLRSRCGIERCKPVPVDCFFWPVQKESARKIGCPFDLHKMLCLLSWFWQLTSSFCLALGML